MQLFIDYKFVLTVVKYSTDSTQPKIDYFEPGGVLDDLQDTVVKLKTFEFSGTNEYW